MIKTRFLTFEDLYEIHCKKCKSTNVYLWVEECPECGSSICGECNDCGSKYDYHEFKKIVVRED